MRSARSGIMIIYNGPSMLDGKPIVVIATSGSVNAKTGNMIQTWILRADMDPLEASATMSDSTVCGDCPHRRSLGGSCYVQLFQAVRSVWYAWWRGSYSTPEAEAKVMKAIANGAGVRLGSYGDPAAVPVEAWAVLLDNAKSRSGYTHQWRLPSAQVYRGLCMASCDTDEDCQEASAMGWRYFRVITPGTIPPAGSIQCLSDAKDLTCAECKICYGAKTERDVQPTSVWIQVHGAVAKRFATTVETVRGRRSAALAVLQA